MDHEKFKDFSFIALKMSQTIQHMLITQEEFVINMCKECDIPLSMKNQILKDLNRFSDRPFR